MRLIIVDDDLLITEAIRDSINWRILGIDNVEIAHNVAGAKRLFDKEIPDIVICDIEMPKGSGIDLIKWVRENNYKSEFIFLTCHENFQFAATALEYKAISYITKPFNIEKTEVAISKAVEKINKENYLNQYSEYGQYWLWNKKILLESFWKDVLFSRIPNKLTLIKEEIEKRNITLDLNEYYYLVLISVNKSEDQLTGMEDQIFEYALKKFSAEIILDEMDIDYTVYYVNDRNHNVVVIVRDSLSLEDIKGRCLSFINNCEKYLKCRAACYISNKSAVNMLSESRIKLEEMDQNNIIFRNNVFFEGDEIICETDGQYNIDANILSSFLENGEKIKIVNYMKQEMELLANRKNLNASVMYLIHQDFMQIVYAFLYNNEIQAHKLFSDKLAQKLSASAVNSMFDMLKWIHFIVTKTIDYVEEVKKSFTIIDKAKEYIHAHYREDITRKDVSAIVFLTPDYLAKIFKLKTGMAVKDYINYYRIEKAKELLKNNCNSISEIAAEVGFDNFSYFSTLFKKITGESPGSFRKVDG